jgi:putative acetyltransferase
VTRRIVRDDVTGVEIRALLTLHFAGMLANSPKDSCHFLDFDGLRSDDVTFWSIWDGDDLAGCGALKEIGAQEGEIKSMRTAEAHLRKGIGAQMLRHIVAEARARGYTRVSLETGSSPAFEAALTLYAEHGFAQCPPFGDYVEDTFSRYMTLELVAD